MNICRTETYNPIDICHEYKGNSILLFGINKGRINFTGFFASGTEAEIYLELTRNSNEVRSYDGISHGKVDQLKRDIIKEGKNPIDALSELESTILTPEAIAKRDRRLPVGAIA